MLSRVAERMYWTGRHMERAENMARLISASTRMALDSPREVPAPWQSMVQILGLDQDFNERYNTADERHVVRFLMADADNPSSIVSALAQARENARTTREILPNEAWEQINDIYWFAREQAMRALPRNQREPFLAKIVRACQLLNGLLAGAMSHDDAYQFVLLGQNLERADMTTRVVDLGAAGMMQLVRNARADQTPTAFANLAWLSVLFCLSGYQMYRQHVQTGIKGQEVVRFLLQDTRFPRAVAHCLAALQDGLSRLPRHKAPLQAAAVMTRQLQGIEISPSLRQGLRTCMDNLQKGLDRIHAAIQKNWFLTNT
jgi:uncharacterized alpha-E superfamily protein